MRVKLSTIVLGLLMAAYAAVAAALFISGAPIVPLFSAFPLIVLVFHVLGSAPVALLLTACTSFLGFFCMGRVPSPDVLILPAIVLALWGGTFLVHLHDQRRHEQKRANDREMEDASKESRTLRQEIDFYEKRRNDLARRADQRRLLAGAARELGAIVNPADIQSKLLQLAQILFPGQRATVSYGQAVDPVEAAVVQKRQPVLVPSEMFQGPPLLAVPITAQHAVAGILKVTGAPAATGYAREDLRLLDILGSLASLALDNSLLFQQAQDTALRDHLTGLLTHRALQERLESEILEASRYSQPLSVILCDVDHFKSVNDTYGHQAGDVLLQGFAHVLDRNVRGDVDVVSRYGGEEFVVLLVNTPHEVACQLAERIRQDVESQEFDAGGRALTMRGSFGVATFPEDATSAQQLMRQADQRLYYAKQHGRNQVRGRR